MPGPLGAASPTAKGLSPLQKIDPALLGGGADYKPVIVETSGDSKILAGSMSLTYTPGGAGGGATMAFGAGPRSKNLKPSALPGVVRGLSYPKLNYKQLKT